MAAGTSEELLPSCLLPSYKIMTKEHPNLYKSVIKGSFWVFALRISTQLLSMLRLVILARLLAPEDFGLLGIALLLMSILQTFTETGFDAALIQKQGDIERYLNTAWTINVLKGLLIFSILFLIAPVAAKFKVPQDAIQTTVNIIRAVGLCCIFNGATNIGTIYFRKELRFDKTFLLGFITNITSIAASIAIAIFYKSVWALVVGQILSSIAGCLISYYIHPYRPKFELDYKKIKELWGFGKWITVGSILAFIMTQGDDLFVWAYLGVTQLGLYQLAYKISNLPATEITTIVNRVTFPAYSLLQHDKKRLRNAYFSSLGKISMLSMPIAVFTIILIPYVVQFGIGEKWANIILTVRILAIFGFLRSIGSSRHPVFSSLGQLKEITILQMAKTIVFALIMPPLVVKYGINGAAIAIVTVDFIGQFVGSLILAKHIETTVSKIWMPVLAKGLPITLLLVVCFYLLKAIIVHVLCN